MSHGLRVQKLTKEAFAACGDVVEIPLDHREDGWEDMPFPIKLDAEAAFMSNSGELQILVVTIAERPMELGILERHEKTSEIVIPLGTPIWLPAAPPSPGTDEPDLELLKVFEIEPHQAVIFGPGAWHFAPFVTQPGATASLLAMYNRGTLSEDTQMVQLGEALKVVAS